MAANAPQDERVRYEVEEPLAWITVNRPDKLNALDRRVMEALDRACERAMQDPKVRVVAVTGAGDKAFVAGADIGEMADLSPEAAQAFSRFLQEVLDRIEAAPKPVIAAVNGFALGGGCELAMACHIRIASRTASFGQPEVALGLIPGAGGTQRLPRLVGRGRALELILGGERIAAEEALRIGLVNRVVEPGELKETVQTMARTLAARSPHALARALEAVVGGADLPLREGQRLEASLFGLCFAHPDMREGTGAFLEKRPPRFADR